MIIKCLLLGFNILFLDEGSIFSTNNNYHAWRRKADDLYFDIGKKEKRNLLLVVSDKEVIYYKINHENTNEQNFLEFIKELNLILSKNINQKFVIVMDNLSVHRTKKLIEYNKEKKMNIIFNLVYRSNFNAIELFFQIIKFTLYNKLYKSIDSSIEEVEKILKDEKIMLPYLIIFRRQ